jgi:iron complex outermembrane receptor protein
MLVALLLPSAQPAQADMQQAQEAEDDAATGPQAVDETQEEAPAGEQEAQPGDQPTYLFGEITVSAQRRDEPLQKVPMAVTVLDTRTLDEQRITTVDEIYARTPGFSFGQFNAVQPQPYVRGIGSTDDSASGDNSVVIFIDEVYVGRAGAFDVDLYDLERVEVLRGPQGTLWGKNAVGGAISIITQKPGPSLKAIGQATVGNYERAELFATVGGPLGDTASGKISVSKRDRDGYTLHSLTGNRLHDEDSLAMRGHLALSPSDSVEVLLSADFQEDDLAGNAREPRGEPFRFFPWFPPAVSSPDPYVAELNTDGFQDREVMGASARVDAQIGLGTFTSITAYRSSDFQFQEDFDGTERGLIVDNVDEDAEQLTQELRLTSSSGGQWSWVAGLYYLREKVDRFDFNDFSGNDAGIALLFGLPPGLLPSFKVSYDQENTTESYAVFGQAKLAASDRVTVSFGGRYTTEKKDARIRGIGFDPVGAFLEAPYSVDVSESWDNFSPQVSVDVAVKEGVFFYATASRGFKSGGFNGSANSGASASTPFDPEEATNIELGLKTQTLGNRLLFNAAAFYTDYRDLQVFQLIEGARLVIDNAADATSQGFELELAARPFEGLNISTGYAYLDAQYDAFVDDQGNDFSGNALTRAPENSGHAAIDYSLPTGERGVVTLGGEYLYQSEIFFDPDNFQLVGDDGHSLLNAHVAFETASGHWRVTAWGKNLSEELYYIHGIDGRGPFNLSQNAAMVVGAPRTYGLSVAFRTR